VEDGGATGADVLVVSPHIPKFDQQAGWLRLYLILQILARRYRVRFLGNVDAAGRRRSEGYTITARVPIPLPAGINFEDLPIKIEGPGINPE